VQVELAFAIGRCVRIPLRAFRAGRRRVALGALAAALLPGPTARAAASPSAFDGAGTGREELTASGDESVDDHSASPTDTTWLVLGAGFGTAGAAAAVALTLTIAANVVGGDARRLRTDTAAQGGSAACYQPSAALGDSCAELQHDLEVQDGLVNAAVPLWIVTGAALGGTSIFGLVALWSDHRHESAARVVPLLGPGTAGVGVQGSF
jgi:hypothetical protein